MLIKRLGEVVDGQYQKYTVMPQLVRSPTLLRKVRLLELVKNYSDDRLERMRRGGPDPEKVYAAYQAAVEHRKRVNRP